MLTRGKLAKRTDCSIETIRYYENAGLMPEPPRSEAGYRMYSDEHEKRLRFILKARSLGFNGPDVHELLRLSDGDASHTRADVKALTETHIAQIKQKIQELENLNQRLSKISSQCDGGSGSAKHCPIITTLYGEND